MPVNSLNCLLFNLSDSLISFIFSNTGVDIATPMEEYCPYRDVLLLLGYLVRAIKAH